MTSPSLVARAAAALMISSAIGFPLIFSLPSPGLAWVPAFKMVTGIPLNPANRPAIRAANCPLALSSITIRTRSSPARKLCASISSRDSLLRSCSSTGSRLSAQRSVGGIAIVVMKAMATIMVKRVSLSTPIERPIEATMISVEPRAFMPVAKARD